MSAGAELELSLVGPRPQWHDEAACIGLPQGWFFPSVGDLDAIASARAVCARCPVRQPCLRWAVDHGVKTGIWGGTSERQRRTIRSARGIGHRRRRQPAELRAAAG